MRPSSIGFGRRQMLQSTAALAAGAALPTGVAAKVAAAPSTTVAGCGPCWPDYSVQGELIQAEHQLTEAPTFTKLGTMLTQAQVSWTTENLYWPSVVHAAALFPDPIADFYMYYSTDHSTGAGGIGLATASDPEGGVE